MIGSPDSYPFEYSARRRIAARQRGQRQSMQTFAPLQPTKAPTLLRKIRVLAARLRRFLNGRVAAAIAHHEQQAALFAQRKLDQRQLDRTRIYRGPLDQVIATAATFRKRAA